MASDGPVTMDAALSGRKTGWFADRGIISVNLILLLSLISSYATGYDGSMMSMSNKLAHLHLTLLM